MKHVTVVVMLLLLGTIFCDGDNGTTDPDPPALTLEGTWKIREYGTQVNDAYQLLIAPDNLSSLLTIENNTYYESGRIFTNTFVDSGLVTERGDSLEFYSRVYHKEFMGKLLENSLAITKNLSWDFEGTATYTKQSGMQ